MSYLKLIANAFWAACYGVTLLAFLFMFLDENLAGGGSAAGVIGGLLIALAVVYVPFLALLFPTLFVFVRFFAARRLGITWFSFKAAVWFGVAVLGGACVVFFHNLRWASSLQSPQARDALRSGLVGMLICWLLAVTLCAMAQARPGAPGRSFRAAGAAALLFPLPLLAWQARGIGQVPELARSEERSASTSPAAQDAGARTLVILGVQGASMNDILPLVAARELPQFERLLKDGGSTGLNSITPCSSLAAWTTLATGMPPWATGVKDGRVHEFALWPGSGPGPRLEVVPRWLGAPALSRAGYLRWRKESVQEARRPMIWEMLRAAGAVVRVAGWPGSPAPAKPPGMRVGDPRVEARLARITGGPAGPVPPAWPPENLDLVRRAIEADLAARDAGLAGLRELGAGPSSRVLAVMYPGLGEIVRHFLRYHRPEDFGDVSPEEQARYGKVVARYYAFLDELLGEVDQAAGPHASLMVVSAHGVAPVAAWERFIRKTMPSGAPAGSAASGSWRDGPDGVMLLRGEGIVAGTKLEEADIKDVVPTTLYLLGLPIERDLRGGLLRRLFSREYLESHPLQLVPGRGASLHPALHRGAWGAIIAAPLSAP